jgi:endonuclease/exonuclease/phosphatase family metal-dependent hydrolase
MLQFAAREQKLAAFLRIFPLVLLLGCEPLFTAWEGSQPADLSQATLIEAAGVAAPDHLEVMTWNLKYGGARINFWFDYWGERAIMTPAEADANIGAMIAMINEIDPDVLISQEVERNSKRTAYRNMVQQVLDGTPLNYAAYVPVWQARFVATQGLGRVDSGIVVYSKYPITEATRIAQKDRTDQDGLTQAFYLHRGILHAKLDVGGGRIVDVINVHTAAYDNDGTKGAHLAQIKELVDGLSSNFIVGGDFNAIPPGTIKHEEFDDEEPVPTDTDFQGAPYKLDAMQPFFDAYTAHLPLAEYEAGDEAAQQEWYSHTVAPPLDDQGRSHFWNRTLDYFFTNSSFAGDRGEVLQKPGDGEDFTVSGSGIIGDPMLLSDHAPVLVKWSLR